MAAGFLKWLKYTGIFLLTLLLCLFLFEIVLRLAQRGDVVDKLEFFDSRGFKLMKPGFSGVVIGSAGNPIAVHINSEGFASPDYPLTTASGTTRIAFFGNSFTKGFEVNQDAKFTSLVEQRLKQAGRAVEVLNFAQGGYNILQSRLTYHHFARKYRPDIVVAVVYSGYDFTAFADPSERAPELLTTKAADLNPRDFFAPPREIRDPAGPRSWKERLLDLEVVRFAVRFVVAHSQLYAAAVELGLLDRPFTAGVGNYMHEIWSYFVPRTEPQETTMRFTARMLASFAEEVRQDGAEFVVMVVPSHWQVDARYLGKIPATAEGLDPLYPHKVLAAQLAGKATIIDLSDSISQAINAERRQVYVKDEGHFTATGHMLAAEAITQFFLNR